MGLIQSKQRLNDDRDYIVTQEGIVSQKWPIPLYLGIMAAFWNIPKQLLGVVMDSVVTKLPMLSERDPRTILQWQKALGQKSQTFHLALCTLIGLTLTFIQMDEIWSYLKKKKRQMWVFITLEARTKFWVNFELGSLTGHTANRLLKWLLYLMPFGFEHFLLITTDKLAAYETAIATNLRKVRYAYLQIVKQRRKKRLVTVKKRLVKGFESDFGQKTQNTSYIERFNLTLRQKVSYLNRKTLGYCKNQKSAQWVMWLNL